MNKDNLIRILIPIIALVVVIESVVLASGLNKNTTNEVASTEVTETPIQEKKEVEPVADFVFATDSKEMKVGKTYKVSLNLSANQDFAVDGIETYVKYDSTKVTISKLTGGTDLPEATVLKKDDKSGLISTTFLIPIEEKAGYKVSTDEIKEVISFVVTPKVEGIFDLELVTEGGEGKLETVLPETGTSKELSFTSNKLEINVTK